MKQIFSTYIKNFKLYLIKIILSVFRFINNYINIVITNATKYVELSNKGYLTLVRVKYHPKMKYLELTYCNNHLLEQYKALKELHKSLFGSEEFLKLGYHKVILVMAIIGKQTFSFHHNILINNNTTFERYYDQIKDNIENLHDNGYEINKVNKFKVLVTNADSNTYDTNSKTKITKDATIASRAVTSLPTTLGQIRKMSTHTRGNAISPTTKKDLRVKSFFTMDIETISVDACMSAKAGVQIPVMITFAGPTCMSAKAGKHFLIDHQLLQHNIDDAVAKL